ncbi:MAG: HD domain-containing protein [Leeuwenhoekiella sp.]
MKTTKANCHIKMNSFLNSIKTHCIDLLTHSRCRTLPFHNLNHTLEVFEKSEVIAKSEGLAKKDLEAVLIASLFHDTGYTSAYAGHEFISITNAMLYLEKLGYPKEQIEQVTACINATKLENKPNSILEKIICDADLAHLGDPDFIEKNERLRLEWANHLNIEYSDEEWFKMNINFLKHQSYYTNYGKRVLEPLKQKHITYFESQLAKGNPC